MQISHKPILDNRTPRSIIVDDNLRRGNVSSCISGLYECAKSFGVNPCPHPGANASAQ